MMAAAAAAAAAGAVAVAVAVVVVVVVVVRVLLYRVYMYFFLLFFYKFVNLLSSSILSYVPNYHLVIFLLLVFINFFYPRFLMSILALLIPLQT